MSEYKAGRDKAIADTADNKRHDKFYYVNKSLEYSQGYYDYLLEINVVDKERGKA